MKWKLRRKILSFLKNPLVIVLPLMVLLWWGWGHYISESRDLSVAAHNVFAAGSFDTFGKQAIPDGWHVSQDAQADYISKPIKGYVGGQAWSVTVRDYKKGSVLLSSEKISVQPDTTYLYKGYYNTSLPFDLLVQYYFTDGTSRWEYVQTYPAEEGQWTTASKAFRTNKTVAAVAFGYTLSGNGTIKLDGSYVEERASDLYLPPAPPTGELLPTNTPLPVKANQHFAYNVDYQSDVPGDVVVEYVLQDGTRTFITAATLTPASYMTRREIHFETPSQAQSMLVHVMAHGTGTLQAAHPLLTEVTMPGAPTFKRPLISITFDDGWKSAYMNGLQIMRQFRFPATFYLNPSVIDTKAFMTTWQIQSLHNSENELGAHGVSHVDMTAVNDNQINFQLEGSERYIKQTLHEGQVDYASPYGKSDAEVQFYARKYFRSVRGTESGINTRQNFDPYNLHVLYVGSKTTPDEIRRAIENAKENNGWLILTYHRIEYPTSETKDSNVVIPPYIFRQQMNLLKQSDVAVVTVQQALDETLPQLVAR